MWWLFKKESHNKNIWRIKWKSWNTMKIWRFEDLYFMGTPIVKIFLVRICPIIGQQSRSRALFVTYECAIDDHIHLHSVQVLQIKRCEFSVCIIYDQQIQFIISKSIAKKCIVFIFLESRYGWNSDNRLGKKFQNYLVEINV